MTERENGFIPVYTVAVSWWWGHGAGVMAVHEVH